MQYIPEVVAYRMKHFNDDYKNYRKRKINTLKNDVLSFQDIKKCICVQVNDAWRLVHVSCARKMGEKLLKSSSLHERRFLYKNIINLATIFFIKIFQKKKFSA